MNCQSQRSICRGNVRWDRNSDSTAAAEQEAKSSLKEGENDEYGWVCQKGLSVDCPRVAQEIHRRCTEEKL